jgi:predicted transcriptional regulator
MAELVLETYDRFSAAYDIVSQLAEKSMSEPELASTLHLSTAVVDKMVTFMIVEGFLRAGMSGSDFRLTSLGFAFLQEFEGLRKFVGK